MKRGRGFRLGRRFIRVWRCAFLRRLNRYRRLDSASPKPSRSGLFDWARRFLPCAGGRGSSFRRVENSCAGEKPPPRGHLAVYVGGGVKDGRGGGGVVEGGSRRYVVPVIYFNHPLFGELLREAEEEFGYEHPGGITIPCPVATFERVRTLIAKSAKARLLH